ncbi:flagellar hook-basal body complex protein FliE [Alkalihalobacillus sp. LMS39]|uniref:flagellar hook-basal body complex protein FliE n=1 Tax=Alkalihalobacillus sp. LMS39 TaxID=2924032 RepID=UPI001FB4D44A|nr:flagellar hook-basal body complex protein FliE [Alkalihalobacillus sp. LMS39]UOE92843.1 flagellar hook-basal body complex protein FliE [Alkalihalobacillus sp. LMS39]
MNINKIQSPFVLPRGLEVKQTPAEAHTKFKQALSDALQNVNKVQNESAKATEALARGEIDDLHNVMITGQKASLTLQATVEVRNKVIEAYQEVMRMQV